MDHLPPDSMLGVKITHSSLSNTLLGELLLKKLHPFLHSEASPELEGLMAEDEVEVLLL